MSFQQLYIIATYEEFVVQRKNFPSVSFFLAECNNFADAQSFATEYLKVRPRKVVPRDKSVEELARVILFLHDDNLSEYYFTLKFPTPNYAIMEFDRQEEYDKFAPSHDIISNNANKYLTCTK